MSSLFNQNSAVMRSLGSFVDVVYLNLLMIVTSLPLVTIGASLSAGYDTARAGTEGRGHITRIYFTSFLKNLAQAIALWLFMAALAITITMVWLFYGGSMPVDTICILLALIWLMVNIWVWPVQARWGAAIPTTLYNALRGMLSCPAATLGMLCVDLGYIAIIIGTMLYLPQGLFLLMVMGIGLPTYIHVLIIKHTTMPQ